MKTAQIIISGVGAAASVISSYHIVVASKTYENEQKRNLNESSRAERFHGNRGSSYEGTKLPMALKIRGARNNFE